MHGIVGDPWLSRHTSIIGKISGHTGNPSAMRFDFTCTGPRLLKPALLEGSLLHQSVCVSVCGHVWVWMPKCAHACGDLRSAPGIIPQDTLYLRIFEIFVDLELTYLAGPWAFASPTLRYKAIPSSSAFKDENKQTSMKRCVLGWNSGLHTCKASNLPPKAMASALWPTLNALVPYLLCRSPNSTPGQMRREGTCGP